MKISPFESPPVTKAQGRGAEGPQSPRPRAEALKGPSAAKAQGRGAEGPQPRGPRAEAPRASHFTFKH